MTRLRLTGGRARGRVVREPVGDGVRPTTDRVREALFSMLGQDLEGLTWLDAYGGSGIVGLEAWSRGATVRIVERDRRTLSALRRRVSELGATVETHHGDVLRLATRLQPVDIVFADPPYAHDPLPVLHALGPLARRWLVLETAATGTLPPEHEGLVQDRARSYGRTALCLYRREADGRSAT